MDIVHSPQRKYCFSGGRLLVRARWHYISIANNVGGIKRFLGTTLHALQGERRFALVSGEEETPEPYEARLQEEASWRMLEAEVTVVK
jgi:hypothetical protein